MSESSDGGGDAGTIQERVRELADAVKKLSREATRLKNNLDRMHKLQSTLYQTDTKILEWLEAGNKLKSAHIPLEEIISSIQKEQSPSNVSK